MEIHDIVNKLVGNICPVGETNEDNKRFDNLKSHLELVYTLLNDINAVATFKDRLEYSMSRAGEKADKFLKDLPTEFERIVGE